MKRIGKIFAIILGLLIVLLLVGGMGGYVWFFQRPQPVVDGTLRVVGLKDRVEIIRDNLGVPHIFARTKEDAVFAQGYVHAQDRLWQMEFNRRITGGRLSEVVGKATLDNDLFLRTMGFRRVAEQEWNMLDADAKSMMEAYARGVNAFISTHQDNLPPEFALLGFKPEPWTPVDSIAWGKVMALNLSGNMGRELLRAQGIAKIGEAKWNELEPGYPPEGPFIVDERVPTAAHLNGTDAENLESFNHALCVPCVSGVDTDELASLARLLDDTRLLALGMHSMDADPSTIFGSNNWVIAGSRTTTGKPILANDPHLGIQMPSVWYEVHLKGGTLDVSGVSFAGVPGVIIGHNARIAWGFTNVGPDVQDLYIEKPNPSNPRQFEFQGQWEDAQVIREEIKLKGADTVVREVLVTRHGPIVTGLGAAAKSNQPLALRWTALEPGLTSASLLKLNEAQNWEQFRAALKLFVVPSQNSIYADVDGNIGYQMPGLIPIRAKGDGAMPVPGWTGEYEWKGYIPYDELPRTFNPPNDYIVTANNAVVPTSYKYFISKEWAAPYRAQRIIDLINAKAKLSPEDVRDIQADTYMIPAKSLAALIGKATPSNETARKAQDALKNWDMRYEEASPAPVVIELFMRRAMSDTFADELGAVYSDYGNNRNVSLPLFIKLAETDPNNAWFDDVTTANKKENAQDILNRALSETADDLAARYGSEPSAWAWGKVHRAAFDHPLGSVKPLDLVFNLSTPVGGGSFSVKVTSVTNSMGVGSISSFRQVIDFGDLARSRIQNSHGQSGLPFNKHFSDQMEDWRDVRLHTMLWTRADIEAHREGTLILVPQQ